MGEESGGGRCATAPLAPIVALPSSENSSSVAGLGRRDAAQQWPHCCTPWHGCTRGRTCARRGPGLWLNARAPARLHSALPILGEEKGQRAAPHRCVWESPMSPHRHGHTRMLGGKDVGCLGMAPPLLTEHPRTAWGGAAGRTPGLSWIRRVTRVGWGYGWAHERTGSWMCSVTVQLLKSADLGRQSLLYLKEIGHGWFGKVSMGHRGVGIRGWGACRIWSLWGCSSSCASLGCGLQGALCAPLRARCSENG